MQQVVPQVAAQSAVHDEVQIRFVLEGIIPVADEQVAERFEHAVLLKDHFEAVFGHDFQR